MKVAILSESPADETVIRILVDALLGQETYTIDGPPLKTRGWPATLTDVPRVLKHLYYRTDADALVVVVDSNHSPVHVEPADCASQCREGCRLCRLRRAVNQVQNYLSPRPNRPRIKTAIGLAVPAIEAWYRCGHDPQVSEASWIKGLAAKSDPYTKNRLKQMVYATDRPSREIAKRRGVEEARRLVEDLNTLEKRFPIGFGSLADDARAWLVP